MTRGESLMGILVTLLAAAFAVLGNVPATVFLSALMITNALMRIYDLIERRRF